eukprot:TRINITY_DN37212_c0_g1_i1.p1 TRINITY_DN37212_c0_g1~~TRINITY_DN37212_c0_g1_i1.p1  ORF type:complete len:350 (+),score=76.80 TRINITY_DN37212_c0_g1_i1:139-1188(+)
MIRRPPRSTLSSSSAASDVYKRQNPNPNPPAPAEGSAAQSSQEVERTAQEFERTAQEWSAVQQHEASEHEGDSEGENPVREPLSSDQALEGLLETDLSEELLQIQPTRPPDGFLARMASCFAPSLEAGLIGERNHFFALAKLKYSDSAKDDLHLSMLRTVFTVMTNTPMADTVMTVGRKGPHWQDIGFQQNDPATDIRGTGMLGVLQFVWLVTEYPGVARFVHQASCIAERGVHHMSQFPPVCTGFEFTKMTLEAMRDGTLIRRANACGQVWLPTFELFGAGLLKFGTAWKRDRLSIKEYLGAKTEVMEFCKSNPDRAIQEFHQAAKALSNTTEDSSCLLYTSPSPRDS